MERERRRSGRVSRRRSDVKKSRGGVGVGGGGWQPWHCDGSCPASGSIGNAVMKRYRSCNNPPQANFEPACSGASLQTTNSTSRGVICSAPGYDQNHCRLGVFSAACQTKCQQGGEMLACRMDGGHCLVCSS